MGALTFSGGDGTVQSTNNGGNSFVTFTSLAARTKGATGDFVITNGTNGSSNKIVLTGVSTGFVGSGYFFDGNSASATYAYTDSTGYVRAISYGAGGDSGAQLDNNNSAFATGDNVEVNTASVTAQGAVSILSLQISDTSTVALTGILTTGGILKTGGNASTLSGGSITTGGSNDLVVRVDQASDTLTISSNLTSTTTGGLTKSGLGTLKLTGTNAYTGGNFLDGGNLQVQSGSLSGAEPRR
jgi:autotransporter-associated beta strand protein